jgi:uncharacterized protein YqeY
LIRRSKKQCLLKTEKGSAEEITEDAEVKIIHKLIKQRRESSDIYKAQGREDLAKIEDEEIEVIGNFLPKQMDKAEVEAVIARLISESGASSVKDMGKVMGLANKELAGKADGKLIAETVKSRLA